MNRELVRDRRFTSVMLVAALFVVVYLAANVFRIGGNDAVVKVNGDLTPIFATLNAAVCVWIWARSSKSDITRRIWALFALGMSLWALAENIWMIYSQGIIPEPPYPSVADIFFLIGYIPLFLSLISRYKTLQVAPTRKQWLVTAMIALPVIVLTVYLIIIPIVREFSSQRIIEEILNITYPLADLALLLVTFFIVYVINEGVFSLAWKVIISGLVLMSFGDLTYYYASWNSIYLPDGRLNAVSILTDYPYNISYLVMSLGIYIYWLTSARRQQEEIAAKVNSDRKVNCDILVFTDGEDNILSCSDNFPKLVGAVDKSQLIKSPLQKALGIEGEKMAAILKQIVEIGYLNDQQLNIVDWQGHSHEVWVTALSTHQADTYSGANIVIRAYLDDRIENDLSQESRLLVDHMLSEVGVFERENRQLIRNYFTAQIQALTQLARTLGGDKIVRALGQVLEASVKENNLPAEINLPDVLLLEQEENKKLAETCMTLLEKAGQYLRGIADSTMVYREMKKAELEFSEGDLKVIDSFGLRKLS